MTTKRLRLMGLTIHANLFIDDGEHAEPIQTEPIQVRAADLDTFVETLRAQIAEEETKLNA